MKLTDDDLKNPYLLPAGPVRDEDDLARQLAIEDRAPGLGWMVLGAGLFVILLMLCIIAGLSFPHWKHLIF